MKKTITSILIAFGLLVVSQSVIAKESYKVSSFGDEVYGHLGDAALNLDIDAQNLSDNIEVPVSMYFFDRVFRLDGLQVHLETGSVSIPSSLGNTINIYGFKVSESKLRYVDGKTFVYYRGDDGWLKIQFEDVGIEGRGDDELVNFQIWINIKTDNIKFHYGANSTKNPLIKITTGITEVGPEPKNDLVNSYRISGLAARFSGVAENTEEVLLEAPHDGFAFTLEPADLVNSVNSTELENSISVYPNPASTQITISFDTNTDIQSVRVIDVMGREIISVQDFNNTIDVSQLKQGIYFVEVIDTEGNTARKKFIKS